MIFENWPPLPIGVGEREHELIYGPNQDMDIASPLMDSPFNLMVGMSQGFFDICVFFFTLLPGGTDKPLGECLFLTGFLFTVTIVTGTSTFF